MATETKPKRRRRKIVGANSYEAPAPTGPIGLTPEQEAENAGTQALIRAFGAVVDCGKAAPLDQTIGIALEALAFAADQQGHAGLRRRIVEMKAELTGMMWEG